MSGGARAFLGIGGIAAAVFAYAAFGNSHQKSLHSGSGGGFTLPSVSIPTTTSSGFTPGQDNAIAKAKDYLDMSGFSKKGLIRQLVDGERFGESDATFAVEYMSTTGAVNWNEQAVRKAKEYLNMSGFSLDGLVQQLEDGEGFTPSQAQYGAKAAYGH